MTSPADADGERPRPDPGDHPDLPRTRQPAGHPRPTADGGAGRARAGRRRQQPRRHRRRSPTNSRRTTTTCTCCIGSAKQGLGAAYVAGFGWALAEGYDVIVEMDADGSHQPEQLPALLAALSDRRRDARVALGARRGGDELAQVPGDLESGRQLLHAGRTRHSAARCDRGLPRLPGQGVALVRPQHRAIAGVLLPDRSRVAQLATRISHRRGADYVRRAGRRREQDEPIDRVRSAVAGDGVGPAQPAAPCGAATPADG